MKEAMAVIGNPEGTVEDKLVAFDNLEMLCEGLDNANNLENLKLWGPLVSQFDSAESELRFMAAWVCGTAVQVGRLGFHSPSSHLCGLLRRLIFLI